MKNVGEPQIGDVLQHGKLLCLVVREFRDKGCRRMVEVLWLDGGDVHDDQFSSHYGYEHNWKDWTWLCGSV